MKLTQFPPGEVIMAGRPFGESLFPEVDRLLGQGSCPDGRLELETEEKRLTCLIHRSLPHLAGLLEKDVFSHVPLKDFPVRARQLLGSTCTLIRTDPIQVLLAAVHFRHRPVLQASCELLDIDHVLDVLDREGQDAVLVLERANTRTLLFLQKGKPARVFFANPSADPGEGTPRERFLLYAYKDPSSGKVEAYKKLNVGPDADAGTTLLRLAEEAKPPPPATLLVHLGGRVMLQRPFMPPSMTIGRDFSCEVIIDNLSVSRLHARISWDRGQFIVEDLGSANGTTLNGQKITRSPVNLNDRIGFGKFEITISEALENFSPDATIMMMPKIDDLPPCLVGDNFTAVLGQETTVGKADGVDVRLRGWFVRPLHATIRKEPSGAYRLVCSHGATIRFNGRKVDNAFLRHGDEVTIGRTTLKVVKPAAETEKT
jgi:pSer/pThr/pTyr-binding forkhead associated (FHA) protein